MPRQLNFTIRIFFALLSILLPAISSAQVKDTAAVYRSANLEIRRLSAGVYVHVSYFRSETFGNVPCNGMVVAVNNEAVVFDTPAEDSASIELIDWMESQLHCRIKAVIPTHFHQDCLGGLKAFEARGIPSYASYKTIALARTRRFPVPVHGFKDSLTLRVGGKKVEARFWGEGHTKDNIVGYFADGRALFGGCLIKEQGAGKGNLEDANERAWPATVQKVRAGYPNARIVIPGHGSTGDLRLLDYTIGLFGG